MRFFVLLLLALLPRLQEQSRTFTVDFSVCCSSDQTTELAATILQQVQLDLEISNIHIRPVQVGALSKSSTDSLGRVDFREVFNGERIITGTTVTVYPLRSPLEMLSPVLEDGLPAGINDSELTTEIISAIIAYATGDCDLLDSLPPIFFNDPINFYRANCALLDDDYEKAIGLYQYACPDPGNH